MSEGGDNRQFSKKIDDSLSKQIADLLKQKPHYVTHLQKPRHIRVLEDDLKIGNAVSVYFKRVTDKELEAVRQKYPLIINNLYLLANHLVEGKYGKRLKLATVSLSEKILMREVLIFLQVIEWCRKGFEKCEIEPHMMMREFELLLLHATEADISDAIFNKDESLTEEQKKLRSFIDNVLSYIPIPEQDLHALVKIFRRFVANLVNPSSASVDMKMEANENVKDTIKSVMVIKNDEQRTRSLVHVVDKILNRPVEGDFDKAIHAVKNIENETDREKPLLHLIDKMAGKKMIAGQRKEIDVPLEKIEEIIQLADQVKASGKRQQALQRIAIGLAKNNRPQLALQVTQMIPDQEMSSYAKSSAINMLVHNKNFKAAQTILEHIALPTYREDGIAFIVNGYLNNNRYEDALQFVEGLKDESEKKQAVKILINVAQAAHDKEKEELVKQRLAQ